MIGLIAMPPYELMKYIANHKGTIENDERAIWAMENMLKPALDDPKWWPFNTIWLAMENGEAHSGEYVGECGFKGKPNLFGEVEIGYHVFEKYRGRGYATEMVELLVEFAKQAEVKLLRAKTANDNYASIAVLKKNDFYQALEDEEWIYWMKNLITIKT